MWRGVRGYLAGFVVLVALAGCGRGIMHYVQREPWREQAEAACMRSGTVREGPAMVRISPIEGPGMCGATQPLKVTAFGVGAAFGFADEGVRPPGSIPGASQPRWPIASQPAASQSISSRPLPPLGTQPPSSMQQPRYVPSAEPRMLAPPPSQDRYAAPPSRPAGPPMSISAPGIDPYAAPPSQYPYPQRPAMDAPRAAYPQGAPSRAAPASRAPNEPDDDEDDDQRIQTRPAAPAPSVNRPLPSLGPSRGPRVTASTPVEIKPAATLACPIVSALDQWIANSVQPAAHKWFGQPVAEIKQISAYSCRGMNGQVGARISEHAFGNALDIAAFVLADGQRITIKGGWQGSAEEQGFLRDVQAAACDQFTTVLAPGSNRYHYDHIHVDLMRRASGRRICQPGAVDGELVAARVRKSGTAMAARPFEPPPTRRYDPPFDSRNDPFAWRGDSTRRGDVTSSIGSRRKPAGDVGAEDLDWVEDPSPRPPIDWSTDRHKVH
jgi:extensin-like protein